jgi:hypothetical protein
LAADIHFVRVPKRDQLLWGQSLVLWTAITLSMQDGMTPSQNQSADWMSFSIDFVSPFLMDATKSESAVDDIERWKLIERNHRFTNFSVQSAKERRGLWSFSSTKRGGP